MALDVPVWHREDGTIGHKLSAISYQLSAISRGRWYGEKANQQVVNREAIGDSRQPMTNNY